MNCPVSARMAEEAPAALTRSRGDSDPRRASAIPRRAVRLAVSTRPSDHCACERLGEPAHAAPGQACGSDSSSNRATRGPAAGSFGAHRVRAFEGRRAGRPLVEQRRAAAGAGVGPQSRQLDVGARFAPSPSRRRSGALATRRARPCRAGPRRACAAGRSRPATGVRPGRRGGPRRPPRPACPGRDAPRIAETAWPPLTLAARSRRPRSPRQDLSAIESARS